MTANSNAQIDTAQSVFGGASLLLAGTDDTVTTPDAAEFTLASSDWVIETRIRFSSLVGPQTFMCHYNNVGNLRAWRWTFTGSGTNTMEWVGYSDGSTIITNMSRSWTPVADTWYAVAVERSGNNLRMYVDGAVLGAAEDVTGDSYFNSTQALMIGAINSSGVIQEFLGWMDDLRWTVGAARYSGAYTPRATAFPNS